jgi:hypothetical protein
MFDQECHCTFKGREYLEIELCDTDQVNDGIEITAAPDLINRLQVWYNKASKPPSKTISSLFS